MLVNDVPLAKFAKVFSTTVLHYMVAMVQITHNLNSTRVCHVCKCKKHVWHQTTHVQKCKV